MKTTLLCAVAAVLASCASTKEVLVRSSPPGAAIVVNGRKVGETPASIPVDQKYPVEIVLEKHGYATATHTLMPESTTMGSILWTSGDPRSKVIRENEVMLSLKKLPPRRMPEASPRSSPARQAPTLRTLPDFSRFSEEKPVLMHSLCAGS